jgi:hypothetical protein
MEIPPYIGVDNPVCRYATVCLSVCPSSGLFPEYWLYVLWCHIGKGVTTLPVASDGGMMERVLKGVEGQKKITTDFNQDSQGSNRAPARCVYMVVLLL